MPSWKFVSRRRCASHCDSSYPCFFIASEAAGTCQSTSRLEGTMQVQELPLFDCMQLCGASAAAEAREGLLKSFMQRCQHFLKHETRLRRWVLVFRNVTVVGPSHGSDLTPQDPAILQEILSNPAESCGSVRIRACTERASAGRRRCWLDLELLFARERGCSSLLSCPKDHSQQLHEITRGSEQKSRTRSRIANSASYPSCFESINQQGFSREP